MNKTLELKIKRGIAKKMNVKPTQVTLLESWSIDNRNYDFELEETFAFNIFYNIYSNEGYKGDILQYSKDDKVLIHNIKIMKQYRL